MRTQTGGFGLLGGFAAALPLCLGATLAMGQVQRTVRADTPARAPDQRVDPSLAQRNQQSANPHRPPAGDEAPPAGWQLGTPTSYRGRPALVVQDADAYRRQLPQRLRGAATKVGTIPRVGDVVTVPQPEVNGPWGTRGTIVGRAGITGGYRSYGFSIGYGHGYGYPSEGYYWHPGSRYWWGYRRGYYHYPQYRYGLVVGQYSPGYAPVPPPEEEPEPLTLLEQADLDLATGYYEDAIRGYRAHLVEEPEDHNVMRRLAVAMLGAKRFSDAEAMMSYAYAQDPTMAHRPMGAQVTGGRAMELRKLVMAAVRHTRSKPSGAGFLLACVLTQARGEDAAALRFLEKAEAEGLSGEIARPLRVELVRS